MISYADIKFGWAIGDIMVEIVSEVKVYGTQRSNLETEIISATFSMADNEDTPLDLYTIKRKYIHDIEQEIKSKAIEQWELLDLYDYVREYAEG